MRGGLQLPDSGIVKRCNVEELPQTLLAAVRYFSDLNVCHGYMRKIKWPDGKIVCPHCQSDRIGEVVTRRILQCKDCRKQVSVKANTIYEDSPLGLDKWFPVIFSEANRIKVSSGVMAIALGVTQKTAWSLRKIIRSAKELVVQTASGERNGFAKLTDDQVAELLALKGKTSQEKAGLQFGLSQVHVGRIWKGFKEFDELARKLVKVPKQEVNEQMAKRVLRKKRKKA